MLKSRIPSPIPITEASQLALLVARLAQQPIVAVDTESNSLHAYQEQVCLLQFSVPDADYLVDPLSGLDLSPLGEIFANPDIEKVFHAAEYDVMCLRRDFGWTFANLFDTMWAARVLGWPRSGLGNILQEKFDVQMNKSWQRHDWGRRPLSSEALAYACLDTHYLIPLREQMMAELEQKERLQEAREFFVQVAQVEPSFRTFDPDRCLWRVKKVRDLEPETRAVLRELLIWRDGEARRRNRPSFKVLNDQILIALAQAQPKHVNQIQDVAGFKSYHVHRYGQKIVRAVLKGTQAKPPQPPPHPRRPSDEVFKRYKALRDWRKKVSGQRGVDSDVIISNAVLWTLAHHAPQTLDQLAKLNTLGAWKHKTYGEALLNVLRQRR